MKKSTLVVALAVIIIAMISLYFLTKDPTNTDNLAAEDIVPMTEEEIEAAVNEGKPIVVELYTLKGLTEAPQEVERFVQQFHGVPYEGELKYLEGADGYDTASQRNKFYYRGTMKKQEE